MYSLTTDCCHFKAHLKIAKETSKQFFTKHKCVCSKRKKAHYNFCVIKDKFTYIFFHSGHINVCKLRKPEDLEQSVSLLLQLLAFNKNDIIKKITIDNITIKGNFNCPFIPLNKLFNHLKTQNYQYFHYDSLLFPAFYIYFKNIKGKVLLFRSGRFSIVGLKKTEDLDLIKWRLTAIIQPFLKMNEKDMLSALYVV